MSARDALGRFFVGGLAALGPPTEDPYGEEEQTEHEDGQCNPAIIVFTFNCTVARHKFGAI